MEPAEDARSRIEAVNRDCMSAYKRADAGGLARRYSDQGQLLPPNSDFVKGTDAIRAFWQGTLDMGVKEALLESLEVEVHSETAVEMGRYRLLIEGGAVADSGKYLVVWKNDGGIWKLHRDIWTTRQSSKSS